MAKRETYSSSIECFVCGKKGMAIWEENENPVYGGGLNAKLISYDGFCRRGDDEFVCEDRAGCKARKGS